MTADDAMSFVREHGIVLASGKGPVPRLAEVIAGERTRAVLGISRERPAETEARPGALSP